MRARQLLITATLILVSANTVAGQERRSTAGSGGGAPRPVVTANPRYPFTGTWIGTMNLALIRRPAPKSN